MNRTTSPLHQHLLTRSDFARMGVPAAQILTWLATSAIEQVGSLGDGEEPVFTVATALRPELSAKLAAFGKPTVVLSPMRVRSFLLRTMLVATPAANATETHEPAADLAEVLQQAGKHTADVETVLQMAAEEARHESEEQPMASAAGEAHDSEEPEDIATEDDSCFDADDLVAELDSLLGDEPDEVAAPAGDDGMDEVLAEPAVETAPAAGGEDAMAEQAVAETDDVVELEVAAHAADGEAPAETAPASASILAALDDILTPDEAPTEAATPATESTAEEAIATDGMAPSVLDALDEILTPDEEPAEVAVASTEHDGMVSDSVAPTESSLLAALDDILTPHEKPVQVATAATESVEPEAPATNTRAEPPPSLMEALDSILTPSAEPTAPATNSSSADDAPGETKSDNAALTEAAAATTPVTPATTTTENEPTSAIAASPTTNTTLDMPAQESVPPPTSHAEETATATLDHDEYTANEPATAVETTPTQAPAHEEVMAHAQSEPDLRAATPAVPEQPSSPAFDIAPIALQADAVLTAALTTTKDAMARVESFLDQLKGALVEMAQRPAPPPAAAAPAPALDVGPLVAALQAGFDRSSQQAASTSAALTTLAEKIGTFGEHVEHGVQQAVRGIQQAEHAHERPATELIITRTDRTPIALFAISAMVIAWSALFWFKTGSSRLALGTLIGANVVGCCLLAAWRRRG